MPDTDKRDLTSASSQGRTTDAPKFTSAPWRYQKWDDNEGWRVMGVTVDGIEDCYCVADVIDGNKEPQNEANARLIAASPDLYEALRTLLDAVEGNRITVGDCNQARSALSRAEGR